MFRYLCEAHPEHTPELRTTHRMTDPRDRAAAEALRDGRIVEALDHLSEAGHLHVVDDDLSLYVGMLRRWWDSRSEGNPHPMVDRRHQTRHQLNRLARRLLSVDGQLGADEIEASGGRAFASGDEVVARMVGRHIHPPGQPEAYVRNGAVGTVAAVLHGQTKADDGLRITFDGVGTVDIPRDFFDEHIGPGGRRDVGIDHAYAVTSYSVQGATYESSTSRIDEGASRSEAYVDITRGRGSNHLFLTRAADPFDGETLPKAPPPPLTETVATRLQGSGPERTALEVDPLAAVRGTSRQAERRGRAATRLGPAETGESILERLPPRPSAPHLARRWDTTVGAVAGYRARWHPPEGTGRWDWAAGSPASDPRATEERNRLIAKVLAVVVDDARTQLRATEPQDLPAWCLRHLEERAARGEYRLDPARTADLYVRIRRYRTGLGLDDEVGAGSELLAEAVLGPIPEDEAARARYRALAAEVAPSVPTRSTAARQIA